MIKDYLKMAVSNLLHRKMRTWLTMLGIFVGIAAVVALISIGQGLEFAIQQEFEEIGTDLLFIQPRGAGFGTAGEDNPTQLTTRDQEEVEKTRGILESATMVMRSVGIENDDEITFQFLAGMPVDPPDEAALAKKIFNVDAEFGRWLEKGDKNKALLGWAYGQDSEDVFERPVRIGDKIEVAGQEFDVVGIMERIGSPPDDRSVVIPIDVADELLNVTRVNGYPARDYIVARVSPGFDINAVADNVERNLRNLRDVDEGQEDFQIQTPEQLLGSFNTILSVVQAVLIGIAAISLLVGGIGIMNTMYTAVLERTKEIGIMKAIGARNSDVMLIFLIESGLLGVVGGAIGVLLGYGLSSVVTAVAQAYLGDNFFITYFPAWLVFGGLAFSFVVGALSGVLPARQASKMNPVDALRYE